MDFLNNNTSNLFPGGTIPTDPFIKLDEDINLEYTDDYANFIMRGDGVRFETPFTVQTVRFLDGREGEYYIAKFHPKSIYLNKDGMPNDRYRVLYLQPIGDKYEEVYKLGHTHIIIKKDPSKEEVFYEMRCVNRNTSAKLAIYHSYRNHTYLKGLNTFQENAIDGEDYDSVKELYNETAWDDTKKTNHFNNLKSIYTFENRLKQLTGGVSIVNNMVNFKVDSTGIISRYDIIKQIMDKNFDIINSPDDSSFLFGYVIKYPLSKEFAIKGIMTMIPNLIYIVNGKILTPDRYKKFDKLPFGIELDEAIVGEILVIYPDMIVGNELLGTPMLKHRLYSQAMEKLLLIHSSIIFNLPFCLEPYTTIDSVVNDFDKMAIVENMKEKLKAVDPRGLMSIKSTLFIPYKEEYITDFLYRYDDILEGLEDKPMDVSLMDSIEDANKYIKKTRKEHDFNEERKHLGLYDRLSDFLGSEYTDSLAGFEDDKIAAFGEILIDEFSSITVAELGLGEADDKRIVLPSGSKDTARYSKFNNYYNI